MVVGNVPDGGDGFFLRIGVVDISDSWFLMTLGLEICGSMGLSFSVTVHSSCLLQKREVTLEVTLKMCYSRRLTSSIERDVGKFNVSS